MVMATVALVFLSVTICAALVEPTVVAANVRLVGDRVAVGSTAVAVPFKATSCGEPVALSETASEAEREPATVGLNSIETVQVALAARLPEQVVADLTKVLAFVPVTVSEVSVTAVEPVFLIVTNCAALPEPTEVEGKLRLAGATLTVMEAPVPVMLVVEDTLALKTSSPA
jgi:hypothetical protein